jgi:phosphoribosyl 1,2-cyclic phosphodiesterase
MIALTFLGTRGETAIRSRRHRRHSALLVQYNKARILIDCGADWRGQLRAVAPTAIVLTHAHADHAAGLAEGAPCPVYATRTTHRLLSRFPTRDRRVITLWRPIMIDGVRFEAVPVQHSIRAPAVGFRVSWKAGCFFYVPDVARLPRVSRALRGVGLYIGDGATVRRSMVRMRNRKSIGHAPIATQLDWCAKANVPAAIFTHCGSPIVRGNARLMNRLIRTLGNERGIDARIAQDGERLSLNRVSRRAPIAGARGGVTRASFPLA